MTTRRTAALLAAALALAAVLPTAVAAAAPVAVDPGAGSVFVVAVECGGAAGDALPERRWSDAASSMLAIDSGGIVSNTIRNVSQTVTVEPYLSFGTWGWTGAAGITEWSFRFCPKTQIGGVLDQAAATLGRVILDSWVPVVLLVVIVAVNLWKTFNRGEPRWGELIRMAAVLAAVAVMVSGAGRSTGGGVGGDYDTPFTPGTGSPGYLVSVVDDATALVAGAVAGGVQDALDSVAALGADEAPLLGCDLYADALVDAYEASYSGAGGVAGATVEAVSALWEESGVEAWKQAQFGGSAYGDIVWCRALEGAGPRSDPTPLENQAAALALGGGSAAGLEGADNAALAWMVPTSTDRAAQLVGWAACGPADPSSAAPFAGAWAWRDPLLVPEAMRGSADAACREFFLGADSPAYPASAWVPKSLSEKDIVAQTGSTTNDAAVFLLWLGRNMPLPSMQAFSYMLSGFAALGSFGVVAVAVAVGKIMSLVFILMMMVMLVVGVARQDSFDTAARLGKRYVGMSVFVAFGSVVFSLVAVFARVVVALGASLPGGVGGMVGILLTGLSPLLGVGLVVWLFKQMGLPSPLRVTGAMAYGQAAEGVGGAGARGGRNALSRFGRRVGSRHLLRAEHDLESSLVGALRGKGKTAGDVAAGGAAAAGGFMLGKTAGGGGPSPEEKAAQEEKAAPSGEAPEEGHGTSDGAPVEREKGFADGRSLDQWGEEHTASGKAAERDFDDPGSEAAKEWWEGLSAQERESHRKAADEDAARRFDDALRAQREGTPWESGDAMLAAARKAFQDGARKRFGSARAAAVTGAKAGALLLSGPVGLGAYALWRGGKTAWKTAGSARRAWVPSWATVKAGVPEPARSVAWRQEVTNRQNLAKATAAAAEARANGEARAVAEAEARAVAEAEAKAAEAKVAEETKAVEEETEMDEESRGTDEQRGQPPEEMQPVGSGGHGGTGGGPPTLGGGSRPRPVVDDPWGVARNPDPDEAEKIERERSERRVGGV